MNTQTHIEPAAAQKVAQKEVSLVLLCFTLPLTVSQTHLAHKTTFSQKNTMFQDQGHGLSGHGGRLGKTDEEKEQEKMSASGKGHRDKRLGHFGRLGNMFILGFAEYSFSSPLQ